MNSQTHLCPVHTTLQSSGPCTVFLVSYTQSHSVF